MISTNKQKLYLQERRSTIQALLEENGRVTVEDLTLRFGVSNVTIRNDLAALEKLGLLRRTHGGAVAFSSDESRADLLFDERQTTQATEKERIGRAAAALVQDGDIIAIDNGTTAHSIARMLTEHRDLTVITNGLGVAIELENKPGITVMVTGGSIHSGSMTLVGEWARNNLASINVDKAFVSSKGITPDDGLTDVNSFIVETKRAIVSCARTVIAVADYTKWGRKSFASYAPISKVDMVITDDKAPQDLVEATRLCGVEVVLV